MKLLSMRTLHEYPGNQMSNMDPAASMPRQQQKRKLVTVLGRVWGEKKRRTDFGTATTKPWFKMKLVMDAISLNDATDPGTAEGREATVFPSGRHLLRKG